MPESIAGVRGDGRSAMGRASDARPFKPYVYNGGDREPGAVAAARQRHRELNAKLERARALGGQRERRRAAEIMPDPAPGWEWYRELAEDDEVAEVAAACDRHQAAMAAVPGPRKPEPAPAPPPVAPARCRRCKYLTTSAGHQVMCNE